LRGGVAKSLDRIEYSSDPKRPPRSCTKGQYRGADSGMYMSSKAIKCVSPEQDMPQRESADRSRISEPLPRRSGMAKPRCPDRTNINLENFVSRVQGFRLELLQIDPGAFMADGFQAYLGDMLIGTARLGRALIQTWKSPAHSITIAVRTSPAPVFWQGIPFGPSDILIAGPETEIELVSQPGFGIASASFPEQEFQRAANGCRSLVDQRKCILVRLTNADGAQSIRAAIGAMISGELARPSDSPTINRGHTGRDDFLDSVVLTVSRGIPFDPSTIKTERVQALEQVVSAIRKQPAEVLTVAALCRISGASERTLHYAFVERYGMPPARFMKACRLNGARKDLCGIDSHALKVSDIANKWGFWHLGQFAKDYRHWFGELPSETRCRNLSGH
jgi:AraC family ethanolamine operon transcriptional activator